MNKLVLFATSLLLTVILSLPAAYSTVIASKPRKGGKVSGQVLDSQTNKPISGAKAILYLKSGVAMRPSYTDENGNFVIPYVPAGIYDVKIIHKYYFDKLYKKITVRDTGTISLRKIWTISRPNLKELIKMDSIQESTRLKQRREMLKGNRLIAGQVLEKYTREPMIGVRVLLLLPDGTRAKLGGITDSKGNFLIFNVPPGIYQVEISYGPDYERQLFKDVKVQNDSPTDLGTVFLIEKIFTGDTI